MCIRVADSLCYTAEANAPLQRNYTPIKMLKKKSCQQLYPLFLFNITEITTKAPLLGTSLVMQCNHSTESACQCRGHGFDPWSGKIPHAAQLSPCITTTDPALWSLGATTTEACAPGACALQQEKPPPRSLRTATKSSPRSLQLEKTRAQQRRPNAAKKLKKKKKNLKKSHCQY